MGTGAVGRVCGDGAVPLLGGTDIPGIRVSGCKKRSLKMLERCRITLGTWGKPLVGQLGWFLFPVLDHWPQGEVKVLPPTLGENSILLLIRFWAPLGSAPL